VKAKVSASPAPLIKDAATGIEMVYVKGGCYKMGNTFGDGWPEEKPAHEVCVDDFYLGKYEVTQGQWKSIMGTNPSHFKDCGDKCPVDSVSWDDAQGFMDILNSKSGGSNYRLPTEAEYEYAQRSGGKSERYSGGNDVDSVSWYGGNSGQEPHGVGTKAPNGLGIHDMSGNVWELTNDWYGSDYYSKSPRNNPTGPSSGERRVKRGGCASGMPQNSRVSRRDGVEPDYRGMDMGFRLRRTIP
jgi:formylglycine-generating enzyme required for sulfatase activity